MHRGSKSMLQAFKRSRCCMQLVQVHPLLCTKRGILQALSCRQLLYTPWESTLSDETHYPMEQVPCPFTRHRIADRAHLCRMSSSSS